LQALRAELARSNERVKRLEFELNRLETHVHRVEMGGQDMLQAVSMCLLNIIGTVLEAVEATSKGLVGTRLAMASDRAGVIEASTLALDRTGSRIIHEAVTAVGQAISRGEQLLGMATETALDALHEEIALTLELAPAATPEDGNTAVAIEYDAKSRVIGAKTPEGRFIKVMYDDKGRVIGAEDGGAVS